MNDYTELIDELRWLAFTYKGNTIDDADKVIIGKAAQVIDELTKKYIKAETDATTLTGELAQAHADIDKLKQQMPKRCYDCDMADGVTCMAMGGVYGREVPKMTWIRRRPDWCPIICSLPEGHGRLIDAEEIMQDIDEDIELDSRGPDDMSIAGGVRERLRMDRGYKKVFKKYMRKRPTIVPAEAENDRNMRPIDALRSKVEFWKKSTTDIALMSVLHDVLKQIDVAIYEMDHKETESPWHRVEEPPPKGFALIGARKRPPEISEDAWDMWVCEYDGEWGWQDMDGYALRGITHWMPIEPPKE